MGDVNNEPILNFVYRSKLLILFSFNLFFNIYLMASDLKKIAKADRRATRRQKRQRELAESFEPVRRMLSSSSNSTIFSTPPATPVSQPMDVDETPERDLVRELGEVALEHNMTQKCLEDLMSVLRTHGVRNLPFTARSVFARTMTTPEFVVESDNFIYIGIKEGLKYVFGAHPEASSVTLNFSTDGLPLSKSSSQKIWPLMMSYDIAPGTVSVIAVCYGVSDPSESDLLDKFIEELNSVLTVGFTYNDINYQVNFGYFVSDLPALALVKCIKGHAGYSSCPKCDIEGTENWLMFVYKRLKYSKY